MFVLTARRWSKTAETCSCAKIQNVSCAVRTGTDLCLSRHSCVYCAAACFGQQSVTIRPVCTVFENKVKKLYNFYPPMARQFPGGQGIVIIEASRSHTHTHTHARTHTPHTCTHTRTHAHTHTRTTHTPHTPHTHTHTQTHTHNEIIFQDS